MSELNVLAASDQRLTVTWSGLLIAVLVSLVFVEAFSGALRFYLDQAGVSYVVYIPKLVALCAAGVAAAFHPRRALFAVTAFVLSIFSVLSYMKGAAWQNVAFSLFSYSPFFFGVAAARHLFLRRDGLALVCALSLLACSAGALLDYSFSLPWKGYSYVLGDIELVANRQWWAMGLDRVAGFSRNSALLAMMAGIFALYLHGAMKALAPKLVVFLVTVCIILVTTNKSALVAYLLAIVVSGFSVTGVRVHCVSAVVIGFLLPAYGIVVGYSDRVGKYDFVLSSLADRLANTWPGFYQLVDRKGGALTGLGVGSIGSTVSAFPSAQSNPFTWPNLGVADSGALYLWGMFGLIGGLLYCSQALLAMRLATDRSDVSRALISVLYFLIVVSWMTDVLESAIAATFMGLAVGHAMGVRGGSSRGLGA